MKRFIRPISWISLLCVAMALAGCDTVPTKVTVLAQPGVAAAAVTANQDAEIIALKAQAVAVDERNKEYLKIGAAAAGNVHGVLIAADHIEAGLPKDAVIAEATLAKDALALPPTAPVELVASYSKSALEAEKRVNLILTGQRDAARAAYEGAKTEARNLRDALAAKDVEIEASKAAVLKVEGERAELVKKAAAELENNKKTQQAALDAKDEALLKFKADVASKERKFWVNGIRIVCGLLILVGVVAIALTKGEAIIQGGIMVGCGIAGIFLAVGFDILTSQKWFPYAFGGIALVAAGAFGWWLWYQWRTHQLYAKTTAAMQDLKDEAVTQGTDLWNKVEEHLKYRIGDKDSPLGKVLTDRLVKRGLDEKEPATPPISTDPQAPDPAK